LFPNPLFGLKSRNSSQLFPLPPLLSTPLAFGFFRFYRSFLRSLLRQAIWPDKCVLRFGDTFAALFSLLPSRARSPLNFQSLRPMLCLKSVFFSTSSLLPRSFFSIYVFNQHFLFLIFYEWNLYRLPFSTTVSVDHHPS